MAVEIELRSRFGKTKHGELLTFLRENADDLGENDKHIYFYVFPDKLLKVVKNISAGTAKVSFKDGRIGEGVAFPEVEYEIASKDVDAAVRVFNALGFEVNMHEAFNRRHDFMYNGVEIALKFSDAWGHHAEFEVLLDDNPTQDDRDEAVERINAVAEKLGVQLMSEEELAEFVRKFEESQAAS